MIDADAGVVPATMPATAIAMAHGEKKVAEAILKRGWNQNLRWPLSWAILQISAIHVRVMSASTGDVAGRVFMSYRREETAFPAGWLFDRLASHFGGSQVFRDVSSVDLGDDFVEAITAAVAACDVLLALIGNRWLTITDQDGHRRLDNPEDFVRLEIEAALARNVLVIPILVEGARMPRADELPARVLDRAIYEAQGQARQRAEDAAPPRRTPHVAEMGSRPVSPASPRLGPVMAGWSVIWALLPVLTIGFLVPFLAPIPFAHAAIRLPGQRLWLITAVYGLGSLTLWILWMVAINENWEAASLIFYFLLLAFSAVATGHAFILRARVFARPGEA